MRQIHIGSHILLLLDARSPPNVPGLIVSIFIRPPIAFPSGRPCDYAIPSPREFLRQDHGHVVARFLRITRGMGLVERAIYARQRIISSFVRNKRWPSDASRDLGFTVLPNSSSLSCAQKARDAPGSAWTISPNAIAGSAIAIGNPLPPPEFAGGHWITSGLDPPSFWHRSLTMIQS